MKMSSATGAAAPLMSRRSWTRQAQCCNASRGGAADAPGVTAACHAHRLLEREDSINILVSVGSSDHHPATKLPNGPTEFGWHRPSVWNI